MVTLPFIRPEAERGAAQIPEIKQLALRTAFHILHGANPQRKSGSGESFWQFREYSAGDMPRDIDWRQSGKTDRVYTRQTERQTAQSCLFWLKQNADMGFQSEGVEHSKQYAGAVIALTLALLHSRAGETIGFAGRQRCGHSEKTLGEFEQILVGDNEEALPASFPIARRASFYGVSDFLEPLADIEAAFAPLAERTHNGCLIHVLDPAELELPYQGRVLFEDMHGGAQTLISNAVDIRGEYAARMRGHIEGLHALCDQWGWRYVLHRSDLGFDETVLKIWLEGAR